MKSRTVQVYHSPIYADAGQTDVFNPDPTKKNGNQIECLTCISSECLLMKILHHKLGG
jgi:hypothetical protein